MHLLHPSAMRSRGASMTRLQRFGLVISAGLVALPATTHAQPAKVIVKNDVVYGKVHGAGLVADIAYPEGKGPFPVILSVHGGRWVASHRGDPGEGAIDVKQWAGFGLFAMTIDYRLVGCTPPPACYQDVQCAIRWIHAHKEQYPIDTERIFLIGMSAGGHLVSLAATLGDGPFPRTGGWEKHSNAVRGVISLSGPYDLEKLSWGTLWRPAAGDQMAARKLASPIQHVSAKTTPILILHSDNDGSVPVQQAQEMAEALERAKAKHRIVVYPKKGHMRITEDVIKESRAFIDEIGKSKPEAPKPAVNGGPQPIRGNSVNGSKQNGREAEALSRRSSPAMQFRRTRDRAEPPSNHFGVHDRQALGDGQGAESLIGANEFDGLGGFVETDRDGELQGIERSKTVRQPNASNQPLGRLKVSGGQANDAQSSRRHIAAEPARQFLKARGGEFADADLLGKHRMELDHRQARDHLHRVRQGEQGVNFRGSRLGMVMFGDGTGVEEMDGHD
jgi:acetyl esterase/lipase